MLRLEMTQNVTSYTLWCNTSNNVLKRVHQSGQSVIIVQYNACMHRLVGSIHLCVAILSGQGKCYKKLIKNYLKFIYPINLKPLWHLIKNFKFLFKNQHNFINLFFFLLLIYFRINMEESFFFKSNKSKNLFFEVPLKSGQMNKMFILTHKLLN